MADENPVNPIILRLHHVSVISNFLYRQELTLEEEAEFEENGVKEQVLSIVSKIKSLGIKSRQEIRHEPEHYERLLKRRQQ